MSWVARICAKSSIASTSRQSAISYGESARLVSFSSVRNSTPCNAPVKPHRIEHAARGLFGVTDVAIAELGLAIGGRQRAVLHRGSRVRIARGFEPRLRVGLRRRRLLLGVAFLVGAAAADPARIATRAASTHARTVSEDPAAGTLGLSAVSTWFDASTAHSFVSLWAAVTTIVGRLPGVTAGRSTERAAAEDSDDQTRRAAWPSRGGDRTEPSEGRRDVARARDASGRGDRGCERARPARGRDPGAARTARTAARDDRARAGDASAVGDATAGRRRSNRSRSSRRAAPRSATSPRCAHRCRSPRSTRRRSCRSVKSRRNPRSAFGSPSRWSRSPRSARHPRVDRDDRAERRWLRGSGSTRASRASPQRRRASRKRPTYKVTVPAGTKALSGAMLGGAGVRHVLDAADLRSRASIRARMRCAPMRRSRCNSIRTSIRRR